MAARKNRWDSANLLLKFGASLQDKIEDGQTVLQVVLKESLLSPRQLAFLIRRSVDYGSKHIIDFTDILTLLSVDTRSSPRSTARNKAWRRDRRRKYPSPRYCERDSDKNLRAIEDLWACIAEASRRQECPLLPNDMGHNLVLYAAIQSNLAAVRCLLRMGFHANGSNPFDYGSCLKHPLPLAPLDVVQWTSYVSNEHCDPTERQLKDINRTIANLLLDCGASHSSTYGNVCSLIPRSYHTMLSLLFIGLVVFGVVPYLLSCFSFLPYQSLLYLMALSCFFPFLVQWKVRWKLFWDDWCGEAHLLLYGGSNRIVCAVISRHIFRLPWIQFQRADKSPHEQTLLLGTKY